MNYTIKEERLTAEEYIEFLKHTDLGSQYPKERFRERIGTLVNRASISLVARSNDGRIVGVCFGITDFAYWLFITDLGVVRECAGQGIGTALVRPGDSIPTRFTACGAISSLRSMTKSWKPPILGGFSFGRMPAKLRIKYSLFKYGKIRLPSSINMSIMPLVAA